MKTQNEILQAIDAEPANLGKIDLRLFESNPDIVRDKLEEKIHMLLEKYGYGFKLLSFRWRDGKVPEAEVIVEKKPDVPLEDSVVEAVPNVAAATTEPATTSIAEVETLKAELARMAEFYEEICKGGIYRGATDEVHAIGEKYLPKEQP